MKVSMQSILISFKIISKIHFKRICFSALNVFLGVVNSFVFGVLFFKFFIEALFEQKNLFHIIILIIVQLVWQILYSYYNEYYSNIYKPKSNAKIQEAIYTRLFDKTVEMGVHTLESPDYLDIFRMVMQKSADAMIFIVENVFNYIMNIILVILNGGLLVTYDPLLFVPIILGVVSSYVLEIIRNKYQIKKNNALNPLFRKFEYIKRIFHSADYALDIKTTNIFDVLIKSSDDTNDSIIQTQRKFNRKLCFIMSLSAVLSILFRYVPYALICANAIITHVLTSGDIAVMISSTGSVRGAINSLLRLYPQIQESSVYITNYQNYLAREAEIEWNEEGEEPAAKANGISLKNVSFSYDGRNAVLKNISIDIEGGEKIAIVGRNGEGKSTIVKLLLRLYKPQSGEIYMDGKPAEAYALKAYRERFGVAFQQTQIYAVSVLENVLMKPCEAGEEQAKEIVENALKRSKLYERIKEEERGVEATLTKEFDQDGIELSGGQAQKLALARVFARNCGIVVLDEPSAALDPISEAEMYESMLEAMTDRTVILVSHRLSACRNVDRIYVIENGRVAEQGSHNELLQREGLYAQMWNLQASGYMDK